MDQNNDNARKIIMEYLTDLNKRIFWANRLLKVYKLISAKPKLVLEFEKALGYIQLVFLRSLTLEICILFKKYTIKNEISLFSLKNNLERYIDLPNFISQELESCCTLIKNKNIYNIRNQEVAHLDYERKKHVVEIVIYETLLNKAENITIEVAKILNYRIPSHNESFRDDLALTQIQSLLQLNSYSVLT